MAARAIGLECGESPVHDFGVALMAISASENISVIERLVGESRVVIVTGAPGIRAVAEAAVLRRVEVPWVLPCCQCAVVAGRAGPKYLIVIHVGHRRPHICAVAILANVGCLNVQRTLACCVGSIVTTTAVVHDVDVVEVRRHPGGRRVTVIAVIAARNVGRVFAGGRNTIVAGIAGAVDLRVIDRIRRYPDVGRMTIFADI